MMMLTIAPIFPVTSETEFRTILTTASTTVKAQAQDLPVKRPYATMDEKTPRPRSIAPTAIAALPMALVGISEISTPGSVSCVCCDDVGPASVDITGPSAIMPSPPITMKLPPIMLRIAIMVTPVGRAQAIVTCCEWEHRI